MGTIAVYMSGVYRALEHAGAAATAEKVYNLRPLKSTGIYHE